MAAADNPYYISPANPMQALMSGVQGYDRSQQQSKEREMQAGRADAAAALQSGGDLKGPLAKLLGIGDTKGAEAIATFAHHQATEAQAKAQQQQQAGQFGLTHGLHKQQFDLAKQQAELAGKGFDLREVEGEDGSKKFIRTNKVSGEADLVPIRGMPTEPANPYSPTSKLTGDESNSRTYVSRMMEAHKTLSAQEDINKGMVGFAEGVAAGHPAIRDSAAFNLANSQERQKNIQAQRSFVNAILRKESGAAIGKDEFISAQRQYFPQPGEGPEVIAQKKRERMLVIEGMMQGAGRGYKPPADYVGTKGSAGVPAKPGGAVGYLDYFGQK